NGDAGSTTETEPKTVVLIHGWTSEASFMSAIAESLRRAGFRVVLFDLPAHGLSPGAHTNIISCARALIDVIDDVGPVHYAVSHSMGGLAALLAAGGDRPYKRACVLDGYVFISTPNDFRDVTREFANGIGLNDAARRHYERHLERVAHQDLNKLSSANYLNFIDRPALMIHSRDDDEILVRNAEQVASACPKVDFRPVDGLGHRRILYASDVTREATKFLSRLSGGEEKVTTVRRTSAPALSQVHELSGPV
ncbi:MAG: alpha/beta fold hydrolase, partial [Pseudomonadota bacterium]